MIYVNIYIFFWYKVKIFVNVNYGNIQSVRMSDLLSLLRHS